MSETLSSGLTLIIPSQGDVNWASSIKSNCFQKISEHDHTGSGKGLAIGTAAIANLAVTEAKLASNCVTTDKIGSAAVQVGQIGNNAVTNTNIASGAITTAKIGDGQVTLAKMATNAVDTNVIIAGGVKTANLFDGAVTEAKLADDAASRSTLIHEVQNSITAGTAGATLVLKYLGASGAISETVIPKACKINYITAIIESGESITGGTLTFTIYKNGVTTGKDVALTTGESYDVGGIPTGEVTFAAGDRLSIFVTKNGLTISATPLIYLVEVWGHFTE